MTQSSTSGDVHVGPPFPLDSLTYEEARFITMCPWNRPYIQKVPFCSNLLEYAFITGFRVCNLSPTFPCRFVGIWERRRFARSVMET